VIFLGLLFCQSAAAEWKQLPSPTLAWLRSVYFADVNHGWIVGSKGTVLTSEDGGGTWRKAKKITDDNIWDVYFSDSKNGWLLCESDIYSGAMSHSYLLQTSDGGKSWERLNFTDSHDRIVRFFFNKDGSGAAIGEGGSIWQMMPDKKSWKRKDLPSKLLMLDGTFVDSLNGVMVGGGGKILVTSDGGGEWNDAIVPSGARARKNSFLFVDHTTGWAVGAQGKIYVSRNRGKSWREQISGVSESLSDVFFVDPVEGYAVGDKGLILETKSAGEKWTTSDARIKSKLERVFFVGKKGFAVGFGGVILTN
jgi:photosystem II stability/assembly factor-like uncharacterized protein